jgi:hypothetical protein
MEGIGQLGNNGGGGGGIPAACNQALAAGRQTDRPPGLARQREPHPIDRTVMSKEKRVGR